MEETTEEKNQTILLLQIALLDNLELEQGHKYGLHNRIKGINVKWEQGRG